MRKLWKTGVLAWKSSDRYLLVRPMPQIRRESTWPSATDSKRSLKGMRVADIKHSASSLRRKMLILLQESCSAFLGHVRNMMLQSTRGPAGYRQQNISIISALIVSVNIVPTQ